MNKVTDHTSLEKGIAVIKAEVKKLPASPGVYRMIAENGEVLYVGKAKALKKRVVSYTMAGKLPFRLQRMVALTRSMEFVYTNTEVEALLLESNLIKKLKPRFNILLRDDKSFPYILITGDHDYPQVTKYRGTKRDRGEYFGPFANAGNVNRTIHTLQRAFMLRNCTDHVFANRSRPCLQYHIKRCTAPCVGYVSQQEYAAQVEEARAYLCGKNREIQERYAARMQDASAQMDYEKAAEYRDRIKVLSATHAHQDINIEGLKDCDVVAMHQHEGRSCIQVFFFRGGQNFGNKSYFPRHEADEDDFAIMAAFLAQFYESKPVPRMILVNIMPEQRELIESALSRRTDYKPEISVPARGARRRIMDFALKNAREALARHEIERKGQSRLLAAVAELFDMDEPPRRIEIYDNSHISGTNMVGGMVVAGADGFIKSAYRKFNIRTADDSDDYGMMREVISRRFKKLSAQAGGQGVDGAGSPSPDESEKPRGDDFPDLLLIDGGLGQYNAVKDVLEDIGIFDEVKMVAISKGPDRDAGREKFFFIGGDGQMRRELQLPEKDPVLHYLQRLRDEAHRFAIGAHRTRRKMDIEKSPLDEIPGVGAARKRALLHHFGSAKAVAAASLEDLLKVDGLSAALAQKIYDWFRG